MRGLNYLSRVTPSTKAVTADILAYLERRGTPLPNHPDKGEPVVWGYDPNAGNKEHHTGRAIDIMVIDKAIGDAIAKYVWKNRKRLGLVHVIWRQRIKSTRVTFGVWRKMADRGSWTENHMDHTHILFDGTAKVGTTPPVTPPIAGAPPFPLEKRSYFGPRSGPRASVSGYYNNRANLQKWQRQMSKRGWRITVDGLYGGQTNSVARAFQREKGLTVDGLIGARTWSAAWTAPIT